MVSEGLRGVLARRSPSPLPVVRPGTEPALLQIPVFQALCALFMGTG